LYIPCIATIGALIREYGLKKAIIISIIDIALALLIGGVTARILSLLTTG